MNVFTIIYTFLCPTCNRVNADTKLYRADDPEKAFRRFSQSPISCVICPPGTPLDTEAKVIVSLATEQDLKDFQVEPDP